MKYCFSYNFKHKVWKLPIDFLSLWQINKTISNMYCKYCGKETSSDNVFCCHCGKRVNPSRIVFNNEKHYDVINAYTVLQYCESGYYYICDLGVGFVILNYNNKKLVSDILFEDVITQGRENVDSILVKKNGKWGLVNPLTGIKICDFIYDDISQLEEDFDNGKGEIIVYSNGLCGKLDCDGNIILPIIYDEISYCDRVKYQGLWGVVRNGKQIIPCEYIKLGGGYYFGEYLSDVALEPSQYKNGKWGVTCGSTIILEFEYDEIKIVGDFQYIMRKGDKWGLVKIETIGKDEFRLPCEYSLEEIEKKCYFY